MDDQTREIMIRVTKRIEGKKVVCRDAKGRIQPCPIIPPQPGGNKVSIGSSGPSDTRPDGSPRTKIKASNLRAPTTKEALERGKPQNDNDWETQPRDQKGRFSFRPLTGWTL